MHICTLHNCTTCQSYVEYVVDVSKGAIIPIMYPQIANTFHSAWPQSVKMMRLQRQIENAIGTMTSATTGLGEPKLQRTKYPLKKIDARRQKQI